MKDIIKIKLFYNIFSGKLFLFFILGSKITKAKTLGRKHSKSYRGSSKGIYIAIFS